VPPLDSRADRGQDGSRPFDRSFLEPLRRDSDVRSILFFLSIATFALAAVAAIYLDRHGWNLLGCSLAGVGLGCLVGNWSQLRMKS
jgi:hypothetical protein